MHVFAHRKKGWRSACPFRCIRVGGGPGLQEEHSSPGRRNDIRLSELSLTS